jgi:uncharacterized protein (TIGR03437 family)
MRFLITALIGCAPLLGQFDNLVTNDDGSVLYFSSPLRMRGTRQVTHRKVFVLDSAGLRLHMQRELQRTSSPDATWPVSNYHSLESVAIDGDGSMVGVIARRDCYGGSGCLPTPKFRTELHGREFRARMSLSRNGRYALLWGDGALAGANSLVDLQTGRIETWLASPAWYGRYGRRFVSSNGTAVFPWRGGLRMLRFDEDKTFPLAAGAVDIAIDDEANTAVYQNAEGLQAIDLETGQTRRLAAGAMAITMQPSISNDGRVALFLGSTGKEPQMFTINSDGNGLRQLTSDESGIREIVMSGDGRIAYAVTASGRLLRVDVGTAAVEEVIGQTPSLERVDSAITPYPVPGSAFSIQGRGLARAPASAGPPLPLSLNGLELLLDGRPLPLQSVEPERVVFQLPWETGLGGHRLEVRTAADPYFENETVEFEIRHLLWPQFERAVEGERSVAGSTYALAAHGDFSAVITRANPARPGEIIHLYMTGLGAVEPFVATGEAAPSDSLARITSPVSCTFAPPDVATSERTADILFAGLAPGFAGYYQVTIRVPEDVPIMHGDSLLACRPPGTFTSDSGWVPMAGNGAR